MTAKGEKESDETRAKKSRAKRGPGKTSPAAVERWQRELECVKLRRAGWTWERIADKLGYASAGHAHMQFMSFMKRYPVEDIEAARALEAQRIDELQAAIYEQCIDQDSDKQHWALDRMIKLMDLRHRLLGLPAPVRQEITVVTQDVVDRALAEKRAEVERLRNTQQALNAAPPIQTVMGEVIRSETIERRSEGE